MLLTGVDMGYLVLLVRFSYVAMSMLSFGRVILLRWVFGLGLAGDGKVESMVLIEAGPLFFDSCIVRNLLRATGLQGGVISTVDFS